MTLIFDIRDTFISIAALHFFDNEKPELILAKSFPISPQDIKNHEKYLAKMIKTLSDSLIIFRKDLIMMGVTASIKKTFFFVGSLWSISKSKVMKITKDKQFEVNKDLLEKYITTEESDMEFSLEKLDEAFDDLVVLEHKIIESKLNGYRVEDIFGKKTNDLELEFFVSFIPRSLGVKISSFINRFKRDGKSIHSSVLSAYSFMRDFVVAKNNFIYIDIGDLITDIFIVRDGAVDGIATIPSGRKEIIKQSESESKTPEDILVSALHIGGEEMNTENKFINVNVNKLVEKIDIALSQICTEIDVPKNIFILNNGDLTATFIKEIKQNTDNIFKMFGADSRINVVDESTFNNLIINAKAFKNELSMKMDIVFLNKILKQK